MSFNRIDAEHERCRSTFAVNPSGLKSTDMHTFGVISELKINFEILNKLTHSIRMGGIIDPYANPIYGGLGVV